MLWYLILVRTFLCACTQHSCVSLGTLDLHKRMVARALRGRILCRAQLPPLDQGAAQCATLYCLLMLHVPTLHGVLTARLHPSASWVCCIWLWVGSTLASRKAQASTALCHNQIGDIQRDCAAQSSLPRVTSRAGSLPFSDLSTAASGDLTSVGHRHALQKSSTLAQESSQLQSSTTPSA